MTVDDGLDLGVSPCGNDGDDVPGAKVGQDEVGVVSLIGEPHAGLWAGFVHDRRITFHIGDLTAAQRDGDRGGQSVAAEMDLDEEATARAAKTLILIPFFSAGGVLMIESIIWTLSCPARVSFSASSITSQIPASVQRRNCR